MSTFHRLAAISDATLTAQLRELNELREQVSKAEQAQRSKSVNARGSRKQNCGPKIAADKSKENKLERRRLGQHDC